MLDPRETNDISIELSVLRLFAAQAGTVWPRAPLPACYRAPFAALTMLAPAQRIVQPMMRQLSQRLAAVMASVMIATGGDLPPAPSSAQFWLSVSVYDSRTGLGLDKVKIVDSKGTVLGVTQADGSLGQWVSSGSSQQLYVEKEGYRRTRYVRFRGEDQITLALQPAPKPEPARTIEPTRTPAPKCPVAKKPIAQPPGAPFDLCPPCQAEPCKVKVAKAATPATRAVKKPLLRTQAATGKIYVVQPGDSLWRIAKRELGDPLLWRGISKLNHLDSTKWLMPGMKLRLPAPLPEKKPRKKVPVAQDPNRREESDSPDWTLRHETT